MKRKIIISMIIITLLFVFGGIYIGVTIEKATAKLDTLITLHQVEIMREHLLIQVKRVQSDINLKNTRHARNINDIIKNVINMESAANICFDCHHKENIQVRLEELGNEIREYKKAISRLFTIRANVRRLELEEDRAFRQGELIISQVYNMITIASDKLETRTRLSLSDIDRTKNLLFFIVGAGPFAVGLLAVVLYKSFTGPLNSLLIATQKVKDGNLDYRIKGLKDEFETVALSFNDMARSLNLSMHTIEESEKRYRILFESAGDAIFILGAEGEYAGRIISANRAAAEMHGYTVKEITSLNIIDDLDIPDDAEKASDFLKRILNGERVKDELFHRRKDGSVFPVEVSAGLLEFMDHKYILAIDRDITERKLADAALRESENRFKAIFNNAVDGILLVDMESKKIYAGNKMICQMLGCSREEIDTLSVMDIYPEDQLPYVLAQFEKQAKGEFMTIPDIPVKRKDDTIFYADISASPITLEGRNYQLGIFRDASERREAEALIVQAKYDWEETFNTITDMITIHDREFNIVRCNKAAEKILGLPFLETTKAKCYEYYHGKKNPPDGCPSCDCYVTGKPASFEFYEPHLKMHLEVRAMPRLNINNELIGLIHVVRDITESRLIEESLKRAEQMKLVGEWAAGLAHEIKNALAGIKISVEVLTRIPDFPKNEMKPMYKVLDEIKRIEKLLKSLLNFAKPPKLQFLLTDVKEILENAIGYSIVQSSENIEKKINIVKEYGENLPRVMVDRLQLRQVFMNILINAAEAMHDMGTITVHTAYNKEKEIFTVDISDTGEGIKENNLHNMFRPFFTTKSKGTGLGLAISRRIIEEHGGYVRAENRESGGAVFYIGLPVKKKKEQIA